MNDNTTPSGNIQELLDKANLKWDDLSEADKQTLVSASQRFRENMLQIQQDHLKDMSQLEHRYKERLMFEAEDFQKDMLRLVEDISGANDER